MFYGKIIGGMLGLLSGNAFLLAVAFLIGHAFDKGLVNLAQFASPQNVERIRRSFFETTFLLLGHLAKADGRINEQEIQHTELIISQMRLGDAQRQEAIALFKRGSKPEFNVAQTVSEFVATCGSQRQLQQTLVMFLVSLALADQSVSATERQALGRVAGLMGYSAAQVDRFIQMAQAQHRFYQQGSSGGSYSGAAGGMNSASQADDAYAALGVSKTASDKEIKRAYRKLMSENHPDKLIAKGVPEDMVKLATEKSQEIATAYEVIKKHRETVAR